MTRRALLLHGLSSAPGGWWRVRGWLEDAGWETTAPALLGHGGRADAPDYRLDSYAGDVRAAAPGPWDLVVGHSLGGAITTVLAAADPGWSARIVQLDPAWHVPAADLAAVSAEQLAELDLTPETVDAQKPGWDARDREGKIAAIRAVRPDAVRRTFADAIEWDVRPAVRALAVPTLVLTGDPAVYTMTPASYADGADAVDLRVVPGAGHSPHRDRPEVTRELMMAWLAG